MPAPATPIDGREVKKHFKSLCLQSVIHRNVRLKGAPSFGQSVLDLILTRHSTQNYLQLLFREILRKTNEDYE